MTPIIFELLAINLSGQFIGMGGGCAVTSSRQNKLSASFSFSSQFMHPFHTNIELYYKKSVLSSNAIHKCLCHSCYVYQLKSIHNVCRESHFETNKKNRLLFATKRQKSENIFEIKAFFGILIESDELNMCDETIKKTCAPVSETNE